MVTYDLLTEEQLLKRVADSDREVAKYIYDKYAPGIYGIILKETENEKVCEEILINTFVSFFSISCKKTSSIPQSIITSLQQIALRYIKHGNGLYVSHKSAEIEDAIYNLELKQG